MCVCVCVSVYVFARVRVRVVGCAVDEDGIHIAMDVHPIPNPAIGHHVRLYGGHRAWETLNVRVRSAYPNASIVMPLRAARDPLAFVVVSATEPHKRWQR